MAEKSVRDRVVDILKEGSATVLDERQNVAESVTVLTVGLGEGEGQQYAEVRVRELPGQ